MARFSPYEMARLEAGDTPLGGPVDLDEDGPFCDCGDPDCRG